MNDDNQKGGKQFNIERFNETRFAEALSNQYISALKLGGDKRVKNLIKHLISLGVEWMLIESDYTDRDYLHDHASYYVLCHAEYPRHCKRIHFFANAENTPRHERDFRGLILSGKQVDASQLGYKGFVVARPLPFAVIGRTVLEPPGAADFSCGAPYEVNLFGLKLMIQGLAFQEQDHVLACCSTVALWTCFHRTRRKFGASLPTPAEITRQATQTFLRQRPLPARNFSLEHLCIAIRQAQLEPEVFPLRTALPVRALLYAYLHYGIPVMLTLSPLKKKGIGHAVTVAGYQKPSMTDLQADVNGAYAWKAGRKKKVYPSFLGDHVQVFYAHDDQLGPYTHSEVTAIESTEIENHKTEIVKTESCITENVKEYKIAFSHCACDGQDHTTEYSLDLGIVPVYHKIRLTFTDVYHVLGQLTVAILLPLGALDMQKVQIKEEETYLPFYDVYLSGLSELKKDIRAAAHLGVEQRSSILFGAHPRFLWRAVLLSKDKQPLVELLLDATDMERALPVYQIIWWDQELMKRAAARWNIKDDNSIREIIARSFSKKLTDILNASIETALKDVEEAEVAAQS